MNRFRLHRSAHQFFAVILPVLLFVGELSAQSESLEWKRLAPLPDPVGFAAPFAGVSRGALIVAGGANFPGKLPWDGGQKIWYDSVFVLPKRDGKWLTGFKLPRPLGYGVSVSTKNGVLCAGGSDAREHFRDVFLLAWRDGKIETKSLPPLPRPMANGSGDLVGNVLYVAGGIEKPDATNSLNTFWSLDLSKSKPSWRELPPCPGPARMLAVAGAHKGSFYLFSGTELSGDADGKPVRRYLIDAWRFSPRDGWERLADLPRAAVAAPSPAILHRGKLIVVSGDDGKLVNFEPKSAHPGFPKDTLSYDPKANQWTVFAGSAFSRATAPVVEWLGEAVVVNGEVRPGVRTPEVLSLPLK